jgi:hypothetical protein
LPESDARRAASGNVLVPPQRDHHP